jgi:UDP-2,3-diacylglucosamine pyrophosphatase LpxH
MDKETIEQCAALAVARYAWQLNLGGVPRKQAWKALDAVAWDIKENQQTAGVHQLAALYQATMPGLANFDEAAKQALWLRLRFIASDFQAGLRDYYNPDAGPKHEVQKKETPAPVLTVVVCSDVHLGTEQANDSAFYQWLDSQHDVQVVLLGDILDLWIYGEDLNDTGLVNIVSAQWLDLNHHHVKAKKRGCDIHNVPGNHDAFIYYIEAAESEPWVATVLNRIPILRSIRRTIKKAELLSVAQIHYPFYRLNIANKTLLLTHGHYSDWFWRMQSGLDDVCLDMGALLLTATVSIAHNHARQFRRINNVKDWLQVTHLIEYTAISITNAVLRAYNGARELLSGKEDKLIEIIDHATALYFTGQAQVSAVEELNLRRALLHMVTHQRKYNSHLERVREEHESFLKRALRTSNVDMEVGLNGVEITHTLLKEYAEFDTLIFGHFHIARDTEGVHDSGSFVNPNVTSLKIDSDGRVYR